MQAAKFNMFGVSAVEPDTCILRLADESLTGLLWPQSFHSRKVSLAAQ